MISLLLSVLLLTACSGGDRPGSSKPPIESRPVEQLNSREARLLGLDFKAEDDSWGPWVGPKLYSMQEAQRLAAETNRKILVDVYAVWCGYCRKMAAETYPASSVIAAVDEYFYTVRIDIESERTLMFNDMEFTESELASAFGVRSFPTTVFIDSDGEPLGMQPGYIDAPLFTTLLEYIGTDAFKTRSFDDFSRGRNR